LTLESEMMGSPRKPLTGLGTIEPTIATAARPA
jgi:hypothetical protein